MAEPSQLTPIQGLPYPAPTQEPADVPLFLRRLAEAIEKKVVQVYASVQDRSTKNPNPTEGQLAWLSDTNQLTIRTGSNTWDVIWPDASPDVLSGTAAPAASLGKNGDIYLRYV